jgi:hypothetical protein
MLKNPKTTKKNPKTTKQGGRLKKSPFSPNDTAFTRIPHCSDLVFVGIENIG